MAKKLTMDEFEKIVADLNSEQSYFIRYNEDDYEILYQPKFNFNKVEFIVKDLIEAMQSDELRDEPFFTSDARLGEFISLLCIKYYTDFYEQYKDASVEQLFALYYVLKSRKWFDDIMLDMFNPNEVMGVQDKVFGALQLSIKYMSTESQLVENVKQHNAEFLERWNELMEKEV